MLKQAELTEQQTWGTVIAAAMGARHAGLTSILLAEAAKFASAETQSAAKTAAAVRLGAVIHALALVLDAEALRA